MKDLFVRILYKNLKYDIIDIWKDKWRWQKSTMNLVQARTNKKEFLEKLEAIIPWETFVELIQPSYYKGELGNKPYPLELMLRIFILQNVYNLADMAVMNEVIDSRAFSNFCGINSPSEVSNGDTIGRFRNILTRNGLQEKIFAAVVKILMERKLILKKGTIVDSTFIESPSSTKNRERNVIRKHILRKREIHGTSGIKHISE